MINFSSPDWQELVLEINRRLEKHYDKVGNIKPNVDADVDFATTWHLRGQIFALELLKKLATQPQEGTEG